MTSDTQLPTTMRAAVRHEYGGTDRLRTETLPVPAPNADQVLVRVHAAAVDRGAWHIMAGNPYMARLVFGLRRPKQPIIGADMAGVVVAAGADVTALSVGDEVYGVCSGSFAEYVAAKAANLGRKPASVSFEEAAAMPVSALTALQALRDKAKVTPGQRVLVIGASGGVGTFAVQIAKARGAHVTGVCSTAKMAAVRALGADDVIDYTAEQIGSRAPFDAILDTGGNRTLRELRRSLTERGTLVIVGGEGQGSIIGIRRQVYATVLSPFVRQRMGTFIATTRTADLDALREMVDAGQVRAIVHGVRPLEEVGLAIDDMVAGRITGKVVIRPT